MSDRPLGDKWDILRAEYFELPQSEIRAMERGFFAGAGVALSWLVEATISDEEMFDRLQSMLAELRSRIKTVRTN